MDMPDGSSMVFRKGGRKLIIGHALDKVLRQGDPPKVRGISIKGKPAIPVCVRVISREAAEVRGDKRCTNQLGHLVYEPKPRPPVPYAVPFVHEGHEVIRLELINIGNKTKIREAVRIRPAGLQQPAEVLNAGSKLVFGKPASWRCDSPAQAVPVRNDIVPEVFLLR